VSRRTRAVAFLVLAGLAAALAAGLADSYGSRAANGYGPLRPVIVTTRPLPAGKALAPAQVAAALELRRVPERFVPAGALRSAADAVGLAPTAGLPAGAYLLTTQLRSPDEGESRSRLGPHRRPVQIAVSGAEALLAIGDGAAPARRVDVVVTTEPSANGRGRTYIAAASVPLLALGSGADGPGPGAASLATLALTRRQALQLIAAESYARRVTLLPVA
jgi:Flp pilus assembly protein CpaB